MRRQGGFFGLGFRPSTTSPRVPTRCRTRWSEGLITFVLPQMFARNPTMTKAWRWSTGGVDHGSIDGRLNSGNWIDVPRSFQKTLRCQEGNAEILGFLALVFDCKWAARCNGSVGFRLNGSIGLPGQI
ncbi:hypothetical protein F383_25547 [Gossypium arboreum]|uniref:Uncharacterized protein n=1 Tax=Gossypium arboreum TaxID=29729 RepID=A0A0B0P691_GOSAR|nr:hypothetical protein F383_25547 [Gossypium arboreum]